METMVGLFRFRRNPIAQVGIKSRSAGRIRPGPLASLADECVRHHVDNLEGRDDEQG
jgi:hypothetical protein